MLSTMQQRPVKAVHPITCRHLLPCINTKVSQDSLQPTVRVYHPECQLQLEKTSAKQWPPSRVFTHQIYWSSNKTMLTINIPKEHSRRARTYRRQLIGTIKGSVRNTDRTPRCKQSKPSQVIAELKKLKMPTLWFRSSSEPNKPDNLRTSSNTKRIYWSNWTVMRSTTSSWKYLRSGKLCTARWSKKMLPVETLPQLLLSSSKTSKRIQVPNQSSETFKIHWLLVHSWVVKPFKT